MALDVIANNEINNKVQKYLLNKDLDKAEIYIDSLLKIFPTNTDIVYNKSLILYNKKDYKNATDLLLKIITNNDTKEIHFQLLSRLYDLQENTPKAIQYIDEGIKKFPSSGRLYYELGLIELADQNREQAANAFEKGIYNDPKFDKNYYQIAKLFNSSHNIIWTIIYAEIYLNITIDNLKAREISKILYDAYQFSIKKKDGNSKFIFFMQDESNNFMANPFKFNFQKLFNEALKNTIKNQNNIYLDDLIKIRKNFISLWFKNNYNIHYPNILFEYHKNIIDNKFFDAYSYAIMSQGDPQAVSIWFQNNNDKFKKYSAWSVKNTLKLNNKNKFSSKQYNY